MLITNHAISNEPWLRWPRVEQLEPESPFVPSAETGTTAAPANAPATPAPVPAWFAPGIISQASRQTSYSPNTALMAAISGLLVAVAPAFTPLST